MTRYCGKIFSASVRASCVFSPTKDIWLQQKLVVVVCSKCASFRYGAFFCACISYKIAKKDCLNHLLIRLQNVQFLHKKGAQYFDTFKQSKKQTNTVVYVVYFCLITEPFSIILGHFMALIWGFIHMMRLFQTTVLTCTLLLLSSEFPVTEAQMQKCKNLKTNLLAKEVTFLPHTGLFSVNFVSSIYKSTR